MLILTKILKIFCFFLENNEEHKSTIFFTFPFAGKTALIFPELSVKILHKALVSSYKSYNSA